MPRSLDDSDINQHFNNAANNTATLINNNPGADAYNLAAYTIGLKAAVLNYTGPIIHAILSDARIVQAFNQGTQQLTSNLLLSGQWLLTGSNAYWVHYYSNNMPLISQYRCYICCNLANTGAMLSALLNGYAGHLYFKVATHDEATMRNDTIVSWHDTLAEAITWARIAEHNLAWLNGTAPAGTFGAAISDSIGIASEVAGETSTNNIAKKAMAKVISKNPYV
ncbi:MULTISPECIES: hypothetical protein [Pseudomonas]|uniref:Uncharacterized protein n=1 Tax=Pseudomonas fluorescens TaxID=294 RepID=A0A162AZR4_PSEFL|nr:MULTISPECIES: hypothetical protein [Pseudomonas]KZN19676.1 hypothetical protein A1D17_27275 [Pseudomonas fluorescens]